MDNKSTPMMYRGRGYTTKEVEKIITAFRDFGLEDFARYTRQRRRIEEFREHYITANSSADEDCRDSLSLRQLDELAMAQYDKAATEFARHLGKSKQLNGFRLRAWQFYNGKPIDPAFYDWILKRMPS